MKRLFLIGYMGAGKTTMGKLLAKTEELEFVDLDLFIESRYQKSIGEIFESVGEHKFREIENNILKEVSEFEDVVISTGGGTACFFDSMPFMNQMGTTIYLKSSPEALAKRLSGFKDKRPLIKNKSEIELLEFISDNLKKREPFYNQAHLIFNTGEFESVEEAEILVDELITELKKLKK